RAALDVAARGEDDAGEVLVLLLGAEDLEALDEGQARVDHHRELPREDGEVLRIDRSRAPLAGRLRGGLLLHGVDLRDEDLLTPERLHRRVNGLGNVLAGDRLPGACSSAVCTCRHVLPSYRRPRRRGWRPRPAESRAGDNT